MQRGFVRLVLGATAAVFVLSSSLAVAQDVSFEGKKEVSLSNVKEPKKTERKTLEQEEGAGPKVNYETDEMAQNTDDAAKTQDASEQEKLKTQQKAIRMLQERIRRTDVDSDDAPRLMERLGDMLWQQAKFYELRAYEYLAQANEAGANGNDAARQDLLAKKGEDEKKARESREEMMRLYQDIIKYHPEYEQMDKIRYFMAFNYAEMGQGADAYALYTDIVREHANSKYLPDAFLGMAEYTFAIEEDMDKALSQYKKVISIDPTTSAAAYAKYKMGWCYFNLEQPKLALAQFESVIKDADAGKGNQRNTMRKEAIKDLVKAYSMWDAAKPGKAYNYFKGFATNEDEVNTMMERLARLYQESGRIEDSNLIYNLLIKNNMGKFKIVSYQYEIMLNIETLSDPQKLAGEIDRTVSIFVEARDKNYEGATPQAVKEISDKLEIYVSETGKWYHNTYTKTKNPLYRSLTFEVYRVYLNNFPNSTNNYEIMYYYADLAYFRGDFAEAAKSYDRVLELQEEGNIDMSKPENEELIRDAAHGAVLAYDKLMSSENTNKEACPDVPEADESVTGLDNLPPLEIAECRLKFIEASKRYSKVETSLEYSIRSKYKAAEIYYNYNHFDEARPLFMDIVKEAPNSDLAVYAANYILESYRRTEKYTGMSEAITEFKGNGSFMANSSELMGEFKGIVDGYEQDLDFRICDQAVSEKRMQDAARCYEKFAENHKDSEDFSRALWNAAVSWERGDNISRAIEVRTKILRNASSNEGCMELMPRAMYTIAQNFHRLAVYSEAARFYEMFVDRFPTDTTACVGIGEEPSKDPCAKNALSNAAAFRQGLGEYDKAVSNYDLYAKLFPKDQIEMAKLKFQTGVIYFDQKKYDAALDRFNEYLKKYASKGSPVERVAVHTYIGKILWAKKNYKEANKSFARAEQQHAAKDTKKWMGSLPAGDPQIMAIDDAAAEARFMQGELIFKETLDIKLNDSSVPAKKVSDYLKTQLQKKSAKMLEATPFYKDILKMYPASTQWKLAALTRLGMMYDDIGHQIEHAPIPPGLPEEVEEVYLEMLLNYTDQMEDVAVQNYLFAIQQAAATGFFSIYTQEAQRRLFDLRPDQYQSASEYKAVPNQMVITYQTGSLFTDYDDLRGKTVREERKFVEEI